MDFTAEGILARMKAELKNEDSRIEGSFTMDNLQAVSEELARFHMMLLVPLLEELSSQEEDMGTSGNERHYIRWAKEAVDEDGKRIAGNAKVSSPRDGTGNVYIAVVTRDAKSPDEREVRLIQEYINAHRPVGANPTVLAAEGRDILISCYIRKKDSYTAETVRTLIRSAVTKYFLEIAFASGSIALNYYTIVTIVSGSDGVQEVENLTVNGEKESIEAEFDRYFSLKELVIHVEQ